MNRTELIAAAEAQGMKLVDEVKKDYAASTLGAIVIFVCGAITGGVATWILTKF